MCSRSFVMALVIGATACLAPAMPARACSLPANPAHTIDPQAQDASLPSAPVATVQLIHRGKGPEQRGCAQSASSCDDLGWIIVQVSATDDQTAAGSLGYRVELASGSLPAGLSLPTTAVRPATSNGLTFVWIDGSSDDQEALAFVLSIRAVDLAGNEGPPTSVAVRDPGSGGCSLGGTSPLASLGAVVAPLLVVAWLLRRTRQRRTTVPWTRGE
jgi:hypothetical protein